MVLGTAIGGAAYWSLETARLLNNVQTDVCRISRDVNVNTVRLGGTADRTPLAGCPAAPC